MLDRDLADLYGVETRVLNQAVKRNIKRFPADFMFKLNRQEINNLSQYVISSTAKHAPNINAFTEQGVAMLSGILKSDRAISVNIQIMRTFIKLKEMMMTHKDLILKIERMESNYDQKFKSIFDAIKMLISENNKLKTKLSYEEKSQKDKKYGFWKRDLI